MGGIAKRYALHPNENTGPGNLRDTVVQAAKMFGWRVYWTHHSKHSPAGFPDLVMVREDRLLFVELKVKGRQPTRAQCDWLAALDHIPCVEAYVWTPDDWVQIREALRYGGPHLNARPLE